MPSQGAGAPGRTGMGGSPSEPGGRCARHGRSPAPSPRDGDGPSLPTTPELGFPLLSPHLNQRNNQSHGHLTLGPRPTQRRCAPERGWHRTETPRSARGAPGWAGLLRPELAPTAKAPSPRLSPSFSPKPSDVEEEGSFGASPRARGTLCDGCPQAAPAPSQHRGRAAPLPAPAPARCCHNLSHNENFNDPVFRSIPRAFPPTPLPPRPGQGRPRSTAGGCNEGTQKRHRTPKRGSVPTVTPPQAAAHGSPTPVCHGVCAARTHIASAEAKAHRSPPPSPPPRARRFAQ